MLQNLVAAAGKKAITLTWSASRMTYTHVVRAWSDCNGNGVFDTRVDLESASSNLATATAG